TGYAYLEELLWRLQQLDARIVEVPIVFTDRTAGTSKASLFEAWDKTKAIGRIVRSRFHGPSGDP
ncbi:MAG: polyprenol monophosphomannose synthase, partial [Planctomycetota bacterium]